MVDEWLLLPTALERRGGADAQAYLRREIQRRLQHWLQFGELEGLRLLELPAVEAWARLFYDQDTIIDELTGQPIPRQEQHWVADPAIDWANSTLTGPEHWPTILIEVSAQIVTPTPEVQTTAPVPRKRKTGRPGRVERQMREALAAGKYTKFTLEQMKEEELAAHYKCARSTARRARNRVLVD